MACLILICKGTTPSFLPYSQNQMIEHFILLFKLFTLLLPEGTTLLPSWTVVEVEHSMEKETGPGG